MLAVVAVSIFRMQKSMEVLLLSSVIVARDGHEACGQVFCFAGGDAPLNRRVLVIRVGWVWMGSSFNQVPTHASYSNAFFVCLLPPLLLFLI